MKTRYIVILISIIFLPIIAYALARLLVQMLSLQPGLGEVIAISLLVFIVLLTVPYLMLKSTFYNAKAANGKEKELHLSDLPKDQSKQQIKYPDSH